MSLLLVAFLFGQEAVNEDCRELLQEVSVEQLREIVTTLAGFGTRHPASDTNSSTRGTGAARRYLKEVMEDCARASEGRMQVREQRFERRVRSGAELQFVNVIAKIDGTDPNRGAWVIGGHYDSRNSRGMDGDGDAPGADDDASGTAVVIELARILAEIEMKADVYLCAFDGEELGLFGSDALAQSMADENIDVEGMITNDIVGASQGPDGKSYADRMRCFSRGFSPGLEDDRFRRTIGGETEGPSRQLARFAALMADRYIAGFDVKLIYRQDRFGRGGDHRSFNNRGYPAIRFTEAVENYNHQHQNVRTENGVQYGDLVEFVDFDYLANVTRVNLAVLLNAAGAPPPPATVALRGAVRHDTTVSWTAVEDDDIAGYHVWRRPTDSSKWTDFTFVSSEQTSHVLEFISIDDWQFGVSSVDESGLESPIRFPARAR